MYYYNYFTTYNCKEEIIMGSRLTQEEVQKRITDTFVQTVSLISEYKNKRSDITLRCEECGYE